MNRRRYLTWLGFGAGGVAAAPLDESAPYGCTRHDDTDPKIPIHAMCRLRGPDGKVYRLGVNITENDMNDERRKEALISGFACTVRRGLQGLCGEEPQATHMKAR